MKAVLDACVLFPTVTRDLLLGAAKSGHLTPFWSEKILDEWFHVANRIGGVEAEFARAQMALMNAFWPKAQIGLEPRDDLWLPDHDDVHVLASALGAGADHIITANLKDFPPRALRPYGVSAIHPDHFLADVARRDPQVLMDVLNEHLDAIGVNQGERPSLRALAKRAKLPRMGKILSA